MRYRLVAWVCALLGLVGASVVVPVTSASAGSGSTAQGSLQWRSCGDGFECATLTVPVDEASPGLGTVDLAVIRAPARDPERRIGSLVMNPGGPGGSGVDFLRDAAGSFTELRERFDLVSWDPRGVGRSDRVDCDYDMARYYALDFTPDNEVERAAFVAGIQSFVDACVASEGEWLRHIGTDATVRDLDRLRAALGDERLTYLGFSYGTVIGARYAAAHPDRVRALVLDGAVDPALDAEALQVQQSAGFEGVLDGFLRWCARTTRCAFHHDGDSAEALDALRARVDREGLPVPGSRPPRVLSPTEFDLGLAAVLYEGRGGYEYLGDALEAAREGDGAAMADLSDSYTERRGDGTYGGIEESFLAISCADGPPVGGVADVRAIEARAEAVAPRTGPGIVNNSLACALWPFQGPPARAIRAPDAPPIVVIGTRRDPATPLAWAEALARQLESGVLVTAPGAQHTAYGLGNRCVDRTVERSLIEGIAPKRDVDCRAH
ncbi:MAG: proteinase [Acidimicrobiia bacterium]